jgi:hypothetical protein
MRKKSAGDHNHEGPDAETPSPATRPRVIRDRTYTWQVGEALENELAPIDPKVIIRAILAQDFTVSVSTAAKGIQGTRLSADSSASWRTDPFREPWGDQALQAAQAPEPVVTTPTPKARLRRRTGARGQCASV